MNDEMLKKIAIAMGYKTSGIQSYYEIVNEDKIITDQKKANIKEFGKVRAEKIDIISRIDVLIGFLMLKNLKTEDENTLIDELCNEAKKLYEMKGE